MAIQTQSYFSGRINNLVFFKRAGTYIVRTQAAKVNRSAASKASSGNFGLASACGKSLRQQLAGVLPNAKDRNMQLRFSGAIAKWLGAANATLLPPAEAVPYVSGFQFNAATAIAERWHLPLQVKRPAPGLLELHIPAFTPRQSIAASVHTVSVECTIAAAGSLLLYGVATGSYSVTLAIPYDDVLIPAQVIPLHLPTPAGALLVTFMSLRYRLAKGSYCSLPGFLPASVVDARYC